MKDLTLREALTRANDAAVADYLSVFFAELARAQIAGDKEMIREANRAIVEVLRGVPDGPIDEPLLPLRRNRQATRSRRK